MRLRERLAGVAMVRLGDPVQAVLTGALRRLGRERPELFERLGPFRRAGIVISPTDLPVAFRLVPDGVRGMVRVVRKDDPAPRAAEISAPLAVLLSLLDGGTDADSAFFSRRVRVQGGTETVIALHNALEAAELTPADVLGLPGPIRSHVNANIAAATALVSALRRRTGKL